MEYTKSEIRELKNLIDNDICILERYTQLYIPDPEMGIVELCIAEKAVTELDTHLKHLKDYCIDTDNYDLAVEIEGKVTPIWENYLEKVTNEEERNRLNSMPGHLHFNNIRDTMLDWLNWLDEYEAEHPKQNTPTNNEQGQDTTDNIEPKQDTPIESNTIIDKDTLQSLFVEVFDAKDYKPQDTHEKSKMLSRLDVLCYRLEMVLSGDDKDIKPNNTNIGGIAYMIYCSQYTKPNWRKPRIEGKKGKFTSLITTIFDIVGKDRPSETSPNKYDTPSQDLIDMFGDILKWEDKK